MTPAVRKLFDYTSRHVTPKDVSDFCPDDPGYPGYVRVFTAILSSGVPPSKSHFHITETIDLTRWSDADGEADPTRFRRFRTFTHSVGVVIVAGAEGPSECIPLNYLAISLLDDAYSLQDTHLMQLLPPVFAELYQRIVETEEVAEEAPFLLLGQLILALLGFAPSADVACLSERIISESSKHAGHASPEFFWGGTFFNQLHHRWKHFVELSFPGDAANNSIAALRDALLYSTDSVA